MYLENYINRHRKPGIPTMTKEQAIEAGALAEWKRMTEEAQAPYVS